MVVVFKFVRSLSGSPINKPGTLRCSTQTAEIDCQAPYSTRAIGSLTNQDLAQRVNEYQAAAAPFVLPVCFGSNNGYRTPG